MKHLSLLIAATLIFLLQGCKSEQAGQMEMPAVPVIAVKPTVKDLIVHLEAIGTLEPSMSAKIYPQVEGVLKEVSVIQGQFVEKGTALFKIEESPYAIKVEEMEAQLAIDRASLLAAEKKYARMKPLYEKDLVSQSEWDNLVTEVEKLQASLSLTEARLKGAQLDLDRCILASPMSGKVGKIDLHPGTLIGRGDAEPLTTINQTDPLLVEFFLTEKEYPKIGERFGEFELKALCSTDSCRNGFITFFDHHFDKTSGLILIRGKISNPYASFFPGQTVHVKIPVATLQNSIFIPQKAVRYNQEGPYIYVVLPDQTVALRQLLLGEEEGADQVVIQGLDPEESVVVDGHLRLSPGLKVEVKP